MSVWTGNWIKINNNTEKVNENKGTNNNTDIPNSEVVKNSFQIFKCFKNGKFLKANEGFYISLCSLSIQSVSFLLYIVLNPKLAFLATLANPTKKNSTDKKQKDNKKAEESGEIINKKEEMGKDEIKEIQKKNACKKESNVINYGNIGEDLN